MMQLTPLEWSVWDVYRRLHAYAAQGEHVIEPSAALPRSLPPRPYRESDGRACRRLIDYRPQLLTALPTPGQRWIHSLRDREFHGFVLWYRWLAISPAAVEQAPGDWIGLRWLPLASFIPPDERASAMVTGWTGFYYRSICLGGREPASDLDVRFPLLEPVQVTAGRIQRDVEAWCRRARIMASDHPELGLPGVLRYLEPSEREQWPIDLLVGCTDLWEPDDLIGEPWLWTQETLEPCIRTLVTSRPAMRIILRIIREFYPTSPARAPALVADGIESAAAHFGIKIKDFRRLWDEECERDLTTAQKDA